MTIENSITLEVFSKTYHKNMYAILIVDKKKKLTIIFLIKHLPQISSKILCKALLIRFKNTLEIKLIIIY